MNATNRIDFGSAEPLATGALRVCAYLRVSTGRQAESDLSIPDQRKQIAAFCAARGWTLVCEFVEPGASATDDNRPEFQKMIERAADGDKPFDLILVHSYSRFFRDSFGLEMYIRKLTKAGVRLISITQELGDDPAQIMMRQVIALFDEYQSREIAKHVLRAMKENARQGFWNGAPVPLGYRAEEVEKRGTRIKKRLVIDPVEAETIKRIFRLYLHGDGKSGPIGMKEIVKRLNEQGYRTKRNARFGVGTLHKILTNTVYVGEWLFNRAESKTGRQKPVAEHITVEVPAIIGRAEFDAVQATLKSRNPRVTPPRVVSGPILLTGLAVCASCNGSMTLRTGTSKSGKVHRYYSCSTCNRMGKTACKGRSIPMDKLDTLVVDHLSKRLFTAERLTEMLASLSARRAGRAAEVDGRIATLQREVSDAEDKLKRLYKMVEDGIAEMDDILKQRIGDLKLDRERAQAALARIQANAAPATDIAPEAIERFGRTMRENIASGEIPFRKAYLRSVVDRIEVDDDVIRIVGDKTTLEQAVGGKGFAGPGVRSFARKWYADSVKNPDKFWGKHGKRIDWFKPYTKVKNASFDGKVSIKWYEDGTTNVSYNCIDRHLKKRGNQVAIIWEGDNPYDDKKITYNELHEHVCRFANVLKKHGVRKGDRVTIYMPMILEAAYAMFACTRLGAIHSVVFGGFSPDALAGRIVDCKSNFVVTADEGLRAGKHIPLKDNTDKAIEIAAKDGVKVDKVVVVRRTGGKIDWVEGRDVWLHEEAASVKPACAPEKMKAEDPLFILYTSGSTGKPKGVLHTTGGYLVYVSMTHQYVFDYHDGDIYWCTADVGWVTGHSYILYGPLANGATTLMFEGVPNYPTPSRMWEVVDKHKVNIFYTAPTAIRALRGVGDEWVEKTSRKTLRILGSVGEPINPEAWEWYFNVVGEKKCPVIDTWWQTETGGIMISPLPGAIDLKAGSATKPFFGIVPELLDGDGNIIEGEGSGNLCMQQAWPGMTRTVFGDHDRYVKTYFSAYKGKYFSGDGCRRDADGYYWITGRVDDVINVSGHRMGTAEVESALVAHDKVAEAAVVGYPHDIKGQGIYCYVTLAEGVAGSDTLRKELITHVRKEIGAIAAPDKIQFAPGLPKTRSAKIMRRILRKIAEDDFGALGDTSTLADPSVVDDLIANRQNKKI